MERGISDISTLTAQILGDLKELKREVQAGRHLEANPPTGGSHTTPAQETQLKAIRAANTGPFIADNSNNNEGEDEGDKSDTHDSTTSIGSLSKSTTVATRPADLGEETSTDALSNQASPDEQENKTDGDEHPSPRDRPRQGVTIGPNQATLEDRQRKTTAQEGGPRPSQSGKRKKLVDARPSLIQQQPEDRSDPPAKKQKVDIKPKADITSLLAQMVSVLSDQQAVLRFCRLVHKTRNPDDPTRREFVLVGNDLDRAVDLYRRYPYAGNEKEVSRFYQLISGIKYQQVVDGILRPTGSSKAATSEVNALMVRMGWEVTKDSRQTLHSRLKKTTRWRETWEPFKGLECFLPFGANGDNLLGRTRQALTYARIKMDGDLRTPLDQDEMEDFHHLLRQAPFIKQLQKTGAQFLASMWKGDLFPEQAWESWSYSELGELALDRLIGLLRPLDQNVFDTPDWQKPESWPYDWPVAPDLVVDGMKCWLCREATCGCIDECFPLVSSSAAQAGKGSGIHADVAYEKNRVLAQIFGRIVPPGSYPCGQALEFRRADLPREPVAGQIHCQNESNLFRRINRACGEHASAGIQGMRISGRYRMVCYARRALARGEEITLEWGKNVSKGKRFCRGCEVAGDPKG